MNLPLKINRNTGSVLEVDNGKKALQIGKKNMTDRYIYSYTDLIIPEIGGRELAGKLKQQYPEIKTLYICSIFNPRIQHLSYGSGKNIYTVQLFLKPSGFYLLLKNPFSILCFYLKMSK